MRAALSLFGLVIGSVAPSMAADLPIDMVVGSRPLGRALALSSYDSDTAKLTLGSLSPTYGSMTVGLAAPVAASISNSISNSVASVRAGQDISGGYSTSLYGGQIGVFGGFADRPTTFAPEPATAWNMGAAVGYAGFYVRGAFTDVVERGVIDTWTSWQAGFGYATGNADLRLTYIESDASAGVARTIGGLDSSQWMLGGNYQISPSIRFNADAFYGLRDASVAGRLSATPGAAAPQGTGARVGVQLKF